MKLRGTIVIFTALALVMGLSACGARNTEGTAYDVDQDSAQEQPADSAAQEGDTSGDAANAEAAEPAAEPEPEAPSVQTVTKSSNLTHKGAYLDNGYEDPDGSNAKMLYVFYTVTAPDSGLKFTSNSVSLRICTEEQALKSPLSGELVLADMSASGKFMRSYYYDNTVETVKHGTKFKVLSTYKVNPSLIEPGKYLKFEDSDVPGIDAIVLPTEDIVTCKSAKAIAKKADPKGYKKEQNAHKKADSKTTQRVNDAIDYYEFYAIYNGLTLKFYFEAPNYFEEHTTGENNSGTYVVQNGYIACTYDDGKHSVDIPWKWKEDGGIDLDILGAVGL